MEEKLRLKSFTKEIDVERNINEASQGKRNSNLKTVYLSSPKGGPNEGPIKITLRMEKQEHEDYAILMPHTFMGNLSQPERPSTV